MLRRKNTLVITKIGKLRTSFFIRMGQGLMLLKITSVVYECQ
jgi:hypothetical protein